MPEIVIPGLVDVGSGTTEAIHQRLKELRQMSKVRLWTHEGTNEECEKDWYEFLLADTPDWIIYSGGR